MQPAHVLLWLLFTLQEIKEISSERMPSLLFYFTPLLMLAQQTIKEEMGQILFISFRSF
jgi:hypothetical protein